MATILITIESTSGDLYTKSTLEVPHQLDPKTTLDSLEGIRDDGEEIDLAELLHGVAEWAARM